MRPIKRPKLSEQLATAELYGAWCLTLILVHFDGAESMLLNYGHPFHHSSSDAQEWAQECHQLCSFRRAYCTVNNGILCVWLCCVCYCQVMLPPGARGTISYIAPPGEYTVNDEVIEIEFQVGNRAEGTQG